uniref:Uncharacterized protein n=1 Tax=Anopheles arabiensis TaxID=7173 RepID=A0A182IGZ1_ANOAR
MSFFLSLPRCPLRRRKRTLATRHAYTPTSEGIRKEEKK